MMVACEQTSSSRWGLALAISSLLVSELVRYYLSKSCDSADQLGHHLGGGINVCAGRNFAKAEIFVAVAMIMSQFKFKDVEWLNADGTLSDRPAADNTGYANAVATPPDREMRVKWRRI